MKWLLACTLTLVPLFCSCHKGQPGSTVATTNAPAVDPVGNPQPRLETIDLYIGTNVLKTEMALTGPQQQTGMMFRKTIGEDEAMLFVYGSPRRASFWMKNTLVPLSIAFIDAEGVILEIHQLAPLDTNSTVSTSQEVQFALETSQGWFERHRVKPGMVVGSSKGALSRVFLRRR